MPPPNWARPGRPLTSRVILAKSPLARPAWLDSQFIGKRLRNCFRTDALVTAKPASARSQDAGLRHGDSTACTARSSERTRVNGGQPNRRRRIPRQPTGSRLHRRRHGTMGIAARQRALIPSGPGAQQIDQRSWHHRPRGLPHHGQHVARGPQAPGLIGTVRLPPGPAPAGCLLVTGSGG